MKKRSPVIAPSRIAFVLKGYPRLSETFIAQEIRGLERRGLALSIVSLRRPTDPAVHALHREIGADVLYLPEYLYQEPRRVHRAWRAVRGTPRYACARSLWLRDLWRDPTPNRVRRFGQALVLAAELPADVGLIYVHFLHTPASVARYASAITGLPFCISAHAKDIWITPDWEKREKLEDCRFATTCTASGAAHLQGLAPSTEILLNHHGLDPSRFPPPRRGLGPDGSDPARPVLLLGVARLVEKKGVDVLLEALARLPPEIAWRYEHVGGGAQRRKLEVKARSLGLVGRIGWLGPRPQDEVLAAYRRADLFVLPSRVAKNGDRDGLPNVLLEAGSQELALVASEVAAVPELIADGANGRLVPEGDAAALARALEALIRDPALRLRLGRAARATVLERFAMEPGLDRLAARLRAELQPMADAAE
jgi:glycosyltransferase involved in cell wall biosynthesis